MSTSTALIAAILTVVVAFITAIVTARTSRKATAQQTDVSLSAEARLWVTQAQSDAKEAKADAAEARREAQAAQVTAHDAEIKLREVSSLTDGLLRWAERIVRAAHDPAISDARLREMVNGGPPELSSSRLQAPR
jgi:hypothetical protein